MNSIPSVTSHWYTAERAQARSRRTSVCTKQGRNRLESQNGKQPALSFPHCKPTLPTKQTSFVLSTNFVRIHFTVTGGGVLVRNWFRSQTLFGAGRTVRKIMRRVTPCLRLKQRWVIQVQRSCLIKRCYAKSRSSLNSPSKVGAPLG